MIASNMPAGLTSGVASDLSIRSEPLRVGRFDTVATLDAAVPDWDIVQDRCPFHHVLLDHRWIRAWWSAFGEGKELHGLVVRHDGNPVGLAPMIFSQGLEAWPSRDSQLQIAEDHRNLVVPAWRRIVPVRRVTFPLNVPCHNSRSHVLIADDPKGVCAAILDYWHDRQSDWDVMMLDGLPVSSGQREMFQAAALARGLPTLPHGRARAMYSADLTGGMEAYLARRGSHFRKRHKAQMRACEKAGRFELRKFCGSDIGRGLDAMFEIESQTWKARPEADAPVRMPIDDRLRRFFTEVAHAYAAKDDAVIHVMSLDGRPAGCLFGLSRDNVMLSLVVYLRDDMRNILNAAPLWDALIRDATARNMTELDIHGVTAYARKWATREDMYQRLYVFSPHLKGRALWASKALATALSRQLARHRDRSKGEHDGRD